MRRLGQVPPISDGRPVHNSGGQSVAYRLVHRRREVRGEQLVVGGSCGRRQSGPVFEVEKFSRVDEAHLLDDLLHDVVCDLVCLTDVVGIAVRVIRRGSARGSDEGEVRQHYLFITAT